MAEKSGFSQQGGNGPQRPDWLAEGAVLREPVSTVNSLLTGKNTGKFAETPESEDY
jgi:hypothetical protein